MSNIKRIYSTIILITISSCCSINKWFIGPEQKDGSPTFSTIQISTPEKELTAPPYYPNEPADFPSFPGAEGFGTFTPGGRFGKLIFVTNLNDTTNPIDPDYLGSLRWALESTWDDDPQNPYDQRRIIIFRTGGTIQLAAPLILRHPFVTIAGQTAPGDGIMLRGDEFTIASHDVIVRNIRVRVGDEGAPTCCRDGIGISTENAVGDVYNVVIDHSSVSWAIDENLSAYTDPNKPYTVYDVTIQWNIISEGLNHSIHVDEEAINGEFDPHSMGVFLGENNYNISIHHNLMAHNNGRNPRISGITRVEVVNNLIYGWGYGAIEFYEKKSMAIVSGNYFKGNHDTVGFEIYINELIDPESTIYLTNNLAEDPRISNIPFEVRVENPNNFAINTLNTPGFGNLTPSPPLIAYVDVLDYGGAIYPMRDAVDKRIVESVRTGSGGMIDSQDEVGGWPTLNPGIYPPDSDFDGIPDTWEVAHGLNPNFAGDSSNYNIRSPEGYSWIEVYVNSLLPNP